MPQAKTPDIEILSIEQAQAATQHFRMLSDPTRMRIIKALAEGQWCVSDLAHALEMDQPAISHQLKYLRQMNVVDWHKEGRRVYYSLDDALLHDLLYLTLDHMSLE